MDCSTRNTRNRECCNKPEEFNNFQKQIQAAQTITEDYEYIKSDKALNDLKNENSKLREENKDMSKTLVRANEVIKDLKKHLDNAQSY